MHDSWRTAGAVRALTIAAIVAAVGLGACGGDDDTDADAPTSAEATTSAPESPTRDPSADSSVQNAAAARFVEAVNSGSTDRVMETLTDDAVVIDTGRRFADPDSIRNWVDSEVTGSKGASQFETNARRTTAWC